MTLLVLALNPSIDAEWRIDGVRWEEKNTIQSERRWAGGKGVNVARWLRHFKESPRLMLPLGGSSGSELQHYLLQEEISTQVLPLKEPTRVNVIVTTKKQGQLRFNPPGPRISPDEWHSILAKVKQLLRGVSVMVLAGSLPQGLAIDAYARLTSLAHQAGVKTILDCDGQAFARAIKSKPFLVKPNGHELAQWSGRNLRTETAVRRAAKALSKATSGWVLVSRGKDGALLVNDAQKIEISARSPKVQVLNTVGAGDALVAAVASKISQDASPSEWLKWGIAAGTAATTCHAGKLPSTAAIRTITGKVQLL